MHVDVHVYYIVHVDVYYMRTTSIDHFLGLMYIYMYILYVLQERMLYVYIFVHKYIVK